MAHSLGPFPFISFTNAQSPLAPPETLREMNEVIQRNGVNGTGVRRIGYKSPPFQMISGVDAPSIAVANQLFVSYQVLTSEGPQTLIWNDADYTGIQTQYIVLDVVCLELVPLRNLVGGFAGQVETGAYLRALWTLQPVHMSQNQLP